MAIKPSIEFPQLSPSAEYMYGAKRGLFGTLCQFQSCFMEKSIQTYNPNPAKLLNTTAAATAEAANREYASTIYVWVH